MNLKEFSRVNRERCESPRGFGHALNSWSLSDWMTATLGELGEAANVLKKLNRFRDGVPGNKETPDQLRAMFARELADAFIYFDLLAQAAGVDLPAAVAETFNAKSEQIGSPIRYLDRSATVPDLIDALRLYLEVLPAFRGKPVGAPGSAARTTHDLHAVAEQMALDAIANAEGAAP